MKMLMQKEVETIVGGLSDSPTLPLAPYLPTSGNIPPGDWGNPIFWKNGYYVGPTE